MNPFKVPTGGEDPATHLMNIGTLENPTWVSKDSGNYKDWLASGSKARPEGSAPGLPPGASDVNPFVALAIAGVVLYFVYKKWGKP